MQSGPHIFFGTGICIEELQVIAEALRHLALPDDERVLEDVDDERVSEDAFDVCDLTARNSILADVIDPFGARAKDENADSLNRP